MNIESGQTLLHYRLVEKLGEGGMGVVWKARDTTLDREVAIKILPDVFSGDVDRLVRFEREAKLLASLTHPNIAAIYGLHEADLSTPSAPSAGSGQAGQAGQAGSVRFLAMEYVAGEDLAQRLARGSLSVSEALDIARQVAFALESAHDNGVIHRDLKPANIQLTPEGQIKVLDFGLAKAFETDPASSAEAGLTHSPTLTSAGTRAGVILGTAAYMSPEQARGHTVDKRADNWSFGCVLYECLTNRKTFQGGTVTDTLARILERDPDWTALPAETPNRVRRLLERCLAKDAKRRLRDIGDAGLELEEAIAERDKSGVYPSAATVSAARPASRWWSVAAAAFVLGALVGGVMLRTVLPVSGSIPPASTQRVSIRIPEELSLQDWTLSPDGQSVIFLAIAKGQGGESERGYLYRRSLDAYEPERIEGTQGAELFVVSPSGQWVALWTSRGDRTVVQKVALAGGPPVTIWEGAANSFGGADWIGDDALIFVSDSNNSELSRISADGGAVEVVATGIESGSGAFGAIRTLPDGTGALVTVYTEGGEGYRGHLEYVSFATGERTTILDDGAFGQYLDGHLVFSRRDTLLAVPFDPRTGQTTGGVKPLMSGMRMRAVWADSTFELSPQGHLLYADGGNIAADRRLVYVDSAGIVEPMSDLLRPFDGGGLFSPDGRHLAVYMSGENRSWQVWVYDVERDSLRRIHVPERDCWAPVWHPDGRRLLFLTGRSGEPAVIYQVDVERGTSAELRRSRSTRRNRPMSGLFRRRSHRMVRCWR